MIIGFISILYKTITLVSIADAMIEANNLVNDLALTNFDMAYNTQTVLHQMNTQIAVNDQTLLELQQQLAVRVTKLELTFGARQDALALIAYEQLLKMRNVEIERSYIDQNRGTFNFGRPTITIIVQGDETPLRSMIKRHGVTITMDMSFVKHNADNRNVPPDKH